MHKLLKLVALSAVAWAGIFSTGLASAQVIIWTDWLVVLPGTPGGGVGTMDGILGDTAVGYVGEVLPNSQVAGGTNYWDPATPYISATVPNAPPASDIIILQGQSSNPITNTIFFSEPITNPVMAIVSLGQPGFEVFYDFAEDFTILSSGTGFWGGAEPDSLFEEAGNVLRGVEGHGTIQFNGTFSSFSWTASPTEFWHGFQVGMPIPEPEIYAMMAAGLGLMGFVARRRKLQIAAA